MSTDLDSFYSQDSIGAWKAIIGEKLHYHFGYFEGQEDLETGLKRSVQNFYPHIPIGSRVLDVGCGWGGPARMLIEERKCSVQGITISQAQAAYCRTLGLDVKLQDIETDELSGEFDVVFMLEVLSHIRDKKKVLRKLRALAPRLVISMTCMADALPTERHVFGGSMELASQSEFVAGLEEAGWRIQSVKNRRFQSLRTITLWKQNLERVYGQTQASGQLVTLQNLTDIALRSPIHWCQSFPLLDIIAEA